MAMTTFRSDQLLQRFPEDPAKLHRTYVTPDGTATFGSDNARHLNQAPEDVVGSAIGKAAEAGARLLVCAQQTGIYAGKGCRHHSAGPAAIVLLLQGQRNDTTIGRRYATRLEHGCGDRQAIATQASRRFGGFRMNPECDPLTLVERQRRFSDERKCLALPERARWPQDPDCPAPGVVNRASPIGTSPA